MGVEVGGVVAVGVVVGEDGMVDVGVKAGVGVQPGVVVAVAVGVAETPSNIPSISIYKAG